MVTPSCGLVMSMNNSNESVYKERPLAQLTFESYVYFEILKMAGTFRKVELKSVYQRFAHITFTREQTKELLYGLRDKGMVKIIQGRVIITNGGNEHENNKDSD